MIQILRRVRNEIQEIHNEMTNLQHVSSNQMLFGPNGGDRLHIPHTSLEIRIDGLVIRVGWISCGDYTSFLVTSDLLLLLSRLLGDWDIPEPVKEARAENLLHDGGL